MGNYFTSLFADTWNHAEKESTEKTESHSNPLNFRTLTILIYLPFALSMVKYFSNTDTLLVYLVNNWPGKFELWFYGLFYGCAEAEFYKKLYWIGMILLFYLLIPVIIVKFGFKEKLKDYGWSFRNVHKDYQLYILMLTVMLPIVFFASMTEAFQERYPIFQPLRQQLFPLFIYWQLAYFLQFVAVEFLFRGFIIHGTKARFGMYAVFVSMVPYCMVHFGKPFGETIAAILAGIVLGTLSLKSRSIILGILIHYSVAITMDLFALYREGILP
jgi:hypothetical protein